MSRRLVLLRHGQTAWNLERRMQGHSDIPLDATGRTQAERAAELLVTLKPARVLSSDLLRARQTAVLVAERVGVELSTHAELRETETGAWTALTVDEVIARFPERYAARERGEPVGPNEGETPMQVAARAVPVILDAAAAASSDATVVVVSHGGTLRGVIGTLLGLGPEDWRLIGPLANCSWSVLGETLAAGQRGWRLLEHNAGTLPTPTMGDDG